MPLPPPLIGPLAAACHGSGPGLLHWFRGRAPTAPDQAWTVACWLKVDQESPESCLVAGFGAGVALEDGQRFVAILDGRLGAWLGGTMIRSPVSPQPGLWHQVTVIFDGRWTIRVLVDGREAARQAVRLTRAGAQVRLAPPSPFPEGRAFCGILREFQIHGQALGDDAVATLVAQGPGDSPLTSTPQGPTPDNRSERFGSNRGLLRPQDPATYPGPAPRVTSCPRPRLLPRPRCPGGDDQRLVLDAGWELGDGDGITAPAEAVSRVGFATGNAPGPWYDATVPGTVLTTLVDQGVYPDPLVGLNNLAIPDDLALRPWWYRTEFILPQSWRERHVRVLLHGINYHAEVWLDGRRLGEITGAFQRGDFDLPPGCLGSGPHALAILVWPQPHAGLASEASHHVGPLPNGGEGTLDGPTFFCSEGWDWIPTIRDRNTGLWQGVELVCSGVVTIQDPQVITELPDLPDLGRARLTLRAEIRNRSDEPQEVTLEGRIAGVLVRVPVSLAPGEERTIEVGPDQVPELTLHQPRLWWPNGHGKPILHPLDLRILGTQGDLHDHLTVQIGLRTIAWTFAPHLVLHVNGRRIPCLGGNWGMDDARKRTSRERLEPYVRLHRDAHLTMIRNWCGQSTSEAFYALCDAYGLLVWNDFWMSTEGYNLPPVDAELLLANAEDTVRRFRHHACIAIWCGRNEGRVPASLDQQLSSLLEHRDGTRHYESSSCNGPHLLESGPWRFQEPETYFTTHGQGFTTELGVTSIPTADAMRAMLPPGQEWPLTDAWTYHDLHSEHAGDSRPYLSALTERYGESTDLDGFCRRAQMLNYVQHRAMFEGFLSKLWQPASGLLAWMSHPAWPSTSWQFYSHDYETHAAYAGVRTACEPIHVQWNLPDRDGEARIAVVNRTTEVLTGCRVEAHILGLDGRTLGRQEWAWIVAPEKAEEIGTIPWASPLESPVQFLVIRLIDGAGRCRSRNVYWRGEREADLRWLQTMPSRPVSAQAHGVRVRDEVLTVVHVTNPWPEPLLLLHLNLREGGSGRRVLPAFTNEVYPTLLVGEERRITITTPADVTPEDLVVSIDGWNVLPGRIVVR